MMWYRQGDGDSDGDGDSAANNALVWTAMAWPCDRSGPS